MVLENSKDLAQIITGHNQLLGMVKLLKEIKSMIAIKEEPAADISGHIIQEMKRILENKHAAAPSPNGKVDVIMSEFNKLRTEMETRLRSTEAALKQ